MMFEFKPLLTIEVQHEYSGGVCPDIHFSIPPDVARVLSGLGLQARARDGVLRVFYPVRETGSVLSSLTVNPLLRVGLRSSNTQLANITDGVSPGAGVALYRNITSVDAFDDPPTKMTLVGQTLSKALASTKRPVSVSFINASKTTVAGEKVTTESGRNNLSLDISGVVPGPYTLEESYTDSTARTACYVDSHFVASGVFAIAEVLVDRSFYSGAPSFKIQLKSRTETVRYYVVVKGFPSGDLDLLSVLDKGYGDPDRPDEVKFERVLPAVLSTDEKARSDQLATDGAKVILFRSTSVVPRRAMGMKKIQLMRSTDALIEQLPQPGPLRESAELIVHLSKTKP